ncbi:hypothetical protein CONPUDRAFT_162572 [Coniophora puteana RWD-64-598 SS2]|uniref:Uncharacterized protein n=1 Tax=Coniophora puteana (strain RWD-64-598) TaxID=741705 RepID=A0A5M3N2W0_CONPW|nr:uncharacterized protein CONPUDRAFT_162572 [Coniophora puteana RWD-64-598 SS2]EIW85364.1 hypothetical protein CONPUDRAFT_162572 [Coniophora puteana RWD-64-598 SS2]
MDSNSQRVQATNTLGRSGSFFGALKSIVAAPFQWFSNTDDEFEDTAGKRRRLPSPANRPRDTGDEYQNAPKRMRIDTPEPEKRQTHYNDPPPSAFLPRRSPRPRSSRATLSPRKTLRPPAGSFATSVSAPRGRRTLSPHPAGIHGPAGMSRTMSLDPPSNFSTLSGPKRLSRDVTMEDIGKETSSRDMSVIRDVSLEPGRRTYMRTSLTPQPSGSNFGPNVPPRRERDPSEPPPLASLISNPTFIKPPQNLQKQGTTDMSQQMTLGSLAQSRKHGNSPSRQGSLLFGSNAPAESSSTPLWPVNAAEKALHELDVYKTPLLPTRLRGSSEIPEMFMPKKKHQITLMHDDRDERPRLGTKGKGKRKVPDSPAKPYAGEGGMKKWLARRKREEEEAKKREEEELMDDDKPLEEQRLDITNTVEALQKKDAIAPPDPTFEPGVPFTSGLETSLRVGRSRSSRNHIERPSSNRMNKFSAAFDVDEDDMADDARAADFKMLEEAAKKAPVFEVPTSFTFAKETPITHDSTNAKEPPVSSLPFSLSNAGSSPVKVTPVQTSTPQVSKTAQAFETPASARAPAPIIPSISFEPPTPQPPKPSKPEAAPSAFDFNKPPAPAPSVASAPESSKKDGIPNFFASSLSKSAASSAPPPSSNLASSAPSLFGIQAPAIGGKLAEATPEPSKAQEAATSLFGTTHKPTQPSLFGSAAPASTSLFAPPAADKASSIFGSTSSAISPSSTTESAQATPSTTTSQVAAPPAAAPALFSFSNSAPEASASKSIFTDGAKTAQPAEPKPSPLMFGSGPSTSGTTSAPFNFGLPSPHPPSASEPSKPGFSFGQADAPKNTSTSTTLEAPKPAFGSQTQPAFSFGQRPSSAPLDPSLENRATSPFSFGSAPATPPAQEKKPAPFSFGTPTTTAPAFNFGTPSASNGTADNNKSVTFGQSTPARPITPPKDQEVSMDESPVRDANVTNDGKPAERPSLNFSFGSGSVLFGNQSSSQPPSAGGFGFNSPSTPNAFGSKPEEKSTENKTGFAFGQSSTNSPFSFGKPLDSPATATSTNAPFSFGQSSPSAAPSSPFTFGTPANSSPFGAAASPASAPTGPFSQPQSTFTFGGSNNTQPSSNGAFTFGSGSQPASPANNNVPLSQPGGSGGAFAFGQSNGSAPSSPFAAPTPPPAEGGGALFTIGAAPQTQTPPGLRQIKKLPNRRGGRR